MSLNQQEFRNLHDQYRVRLLNSMTAFTRNRDEAEDITATAFIAAFKNLERFRGEASFYTWLYRIAHNIAISTLESRRRRDTRELPMPDSADRMGGWNDPDRVLVIEEQRQAMLAAIQELPPIDKQVICIRRTVAGK